MSIWLNDWMILFQMYLKYKENQKKTTNKANINNFLEYSVMWILITGHTL